MTGPQPEAVRGDGPAHGLAVKWAAFRIEAWWKLEKLSDRLWERVCRDGVSCWLDWLPALTYRHRKNAEKKHFLLKNGVPL